MGEAWEQGCEKVVLNNYRQSSEHLQFTNTVDTLLLRITDTLHTPDFTQAIHNDPNLVDICRSFQQDCPCTIAAVVNIRLALVLIVLASA